MAQQQWRRCGALDIDVCFLFLPFAVDVFSAESLSFSHLFRDNYPTEVLYAFAYCQDFILFDTRVFVIFRYGEASSNMFVDDFLTQGGANVYVRNYQICRKCKTNEYLFCATCIMSGFSHAYPSWFTSIPFVACRHFLFFLHSCLLFDF